MNSVLGPTLTSTLTTNRHDACVDAWCKHLQQRIHSQTELSLTQAQHWHCPMLAGSRVSWLENRLGEPWLRIIEDPQAAPIEPFHRAGWLSLEICVEDVDTLGKTLEGSAFKIIGQPADLDISPDIRAMQAIGPAGEVLYLTQIKGEVAGFELPLARCPVDRLFIPVLLVHDRESAVALYEQLSGAQGIKFDTKITVLNRAHDLPVEQRHPVATLQLAGSHLIEIDQFNNLQNPPGSLPGLPSGISMISFALNTMNALPDNHQIYTIPEGPYAGLRASLLRGKGGELIEIIETGQAG